MNDTEIAKAKRDFELKKAAYDVEVQTKVFPENLRWKFNRFTMISFQKAEAELAYELQAAKTKQRIKEENMQIKVSKFHFSLFLGSMTHLSFAQGNRKDSGDCNSRARDTAKRKGAG